MEITFDGSSKFFDVADNMSRLFPEESYVIMERFTFNLYSLSFVLVERPTEFGLRQGRDFARIMKVRCNHPKVEFMDFGFCMPRITHLGLHESLNSAIVELDNYARITGDKVIVKTETIKLHELKRAIAL